MRRESIFYPTYPTIALHGDRGTPEMLRRDMGDPNWVDQYYDARGWRDAEAAYASFRRDLIDIGPSILVGYSRGGSMIGRLSLDLPGLIRAAVIYEGPVADSSSATGSFDVLLVWNNRGALRYGARVDEAIESIESWSRRPYCKIMIGRGKHMQLRPPGHCWDRSLNNRIEEWIDARKFAE